MSQFVDVDMIPQEASLGNKGVHHCKAGQETVHDIMSKTTELFNQFKTINLGVQKTKDGEAKITRITDILKDLQTKFDHLRTHYNTVDELCSNYNFMQVKSLIPFKDDPDNVEQIQKHRRNLSPAANIDTLREKEELTKKIAETDEVLEHVANELRDFIYEINTMIHTGKN